MPLLTTEQLQEIRQIVEDYHDAFIVNTVSPEAVTAPVLERLREQGLVNVKVESTKDAYLYGQALALMQSDKFANMGYNEFKQYLKKNPIPLSEAEVHAVNMAQMSAGQACKGLGNFVAARSGALIIEGDAELRARTEGIIQDATALNIARRETVQRLKSDLGWATDDWSRDWNRIAVTEKQNAMQRGVADHYRDEYGGDVLVAKRRMHDSCRHCSRVYEGTDGQPIIFKLSELEAHGTNVGRKAMDWQAVVGVVHPNCQCQMIRIPEGWGFNEEGQAVPGGDLGERYKGPAKLERAWQQFDDMQKAFKIRKNIVFQDIPIAIENAAGTIRKWTDAQGGTGKTKMLVGYGYIKRTNGIDEDEIDVFVGPDPQANMAYIVHQQDPNTGRYDECKCFVGVSNVKEAKKLYDVHYDRPDFFGWIEAMSIDAFKRWIELTPPNKGEMLKSHSFESRANSNSSDVVLSSEILERCAFFVKGERFISWPEAARSGISFLAACGQSSTVKGLPDRRLISTQLPGNFVKAMSCIPKSQGLLKVPSSRSPVVSPMFGVGQQLQIGDVIIEAIPVAVMNNFRGVESTAKMSFHDNSMLKSLASIHPNKPILCLGLREFTDMSTLKFSSHESDHIHSNHKNQAPHLRLVIPLEKGLDANIGAITSPMGNRNVTGFGPNYITADIPERPAPASLDDVGYRPDSRELMEHFFQGVEAQNPLKVEKEVYEFQEPIRHLRPIEVPQEWVDQATEARRGHEDRMFYLVEERIRNAGRPKNLVDVKDLEGTETSQEGIQKSSPYIGPRGGKWADPKHTIPWREGKKAPERVPIIVVPQISVAVLSKLPPGLTPKEHVELASKIIKQHNGLLAKTLKVLETVSGPGAIVKGRVKVLESALGKIIRKPEEYPSADKLQDVTGTRVVHDTVAQVRDTVGKLRKLYKVVDEDDYITKPQGNYRSYHLILEDPNTGLQFEAQIRTRNQDTFAEWAHNVYKPVNEVQAEHRADPEVGDYERKMAEYFWEIDNGKVDATPPPCTTTIKIAFGCLL